MSTDSPIASARRWSQAQPANIGGWLVQTSTNAGYSKPFAASMIDCVHIFDWRGT